MARGQVRAFAREWMGKIATSRKQYARSERYNNGKTVKKWFLHDSPVTGWVVGIRTIFDGHAEFIGYEEGVAWVPSSGHRVAMIATRPDATVVYVPLEDLEHFEGEYRFTYNQPAYSESYKQMLREDAALQPRDANGRFIKVQR